MNCTLSKIKIIFNKINKTINKLASSFSEITMIKAIRQGLVSIIPILMIGAFALIIRWFPISQYQNFLNSSTNSVGSFIARLLDMIHNCTFGILSICMCVTIGYHYAGNKNSKNTIANIGCPLVSVATFIIFTGVENLSTQTLGPKGMFIAIVSSLLASSVFLKLQKRISIKKLLSDGVDINLNNSIQLIFPMAITISIFALINETILLISSGLNVHDLFLKFANYLFKFTGDGFFSGLLFVFLISFLWFFGIHGSDVLEGVCENLFTGNLKINADLIALGLEPTEILTKQFFDSFVLMGGCGSTICLLIALLLFSKRKGNKNLGKMAAFPMAFNINEIMVFGLPIIFNPYFLIPFIFVPIICYLISYFALATGIVPLTMNMGLEWTTPIILGGYLSTNSIMGSILQIFNLFVGVFIYLPFVKIYDQAKLNSIKKDYDNLVTVMKDMEKNKGSIILTELSGNNGVFAKSLANDILYALENKDIELFYQPQYNFDGKCVGVEALLRYNYNSVGYIYPPLIIKLVDESGKLDKLERYIFKQVLLDSSIIKIYFDENVKISANVTATSLQDKEFINFLMELAKENPNNNLCIEVTEQTTLLFTDELKMTMHNLKNVGYTFAIDDFSAGSTSLHYLQESYFDIVKLDGSIVRNCISNPRSYEIATKIIALSKDLGFKVIAEYVSNEEIRDCMANAGCTIYQGWYYSPAIKLSDLILLPKKQNN